MVFPDLEPDGATSVAYELLTCFADPKIAMSHTPKHATTQRRAPEITDLRFAVRYESFLQIIHIIYYPFSLAYSFCPETSIRKHNKDFFVKKMKTNIYIFRSTQFFKKGAQAACYRRNYTHLPPKS